MLVSTGDDGTIRLWDVATGRGRILVNGAGSMMSIAFSPDGEVVSGMVNSQMKLWSVRTGQEIQNEQLMTWALGAAAESPKLNASAVRASNKFGEITLVIWEKNQTLGTLIPLEDDWVVITTDGRFDTNKSLDEIDGLHWIVSDDPLSRAPLEIFMRDYYEPKLLPRLLKCLDNRSCDDEFSKLPNIAELNRVQPEVRITKVTEPDLNRKVKVTVDVEKGQLAAASCKMKKCETGAFDLRLFRDGQLVGSFPEDGRNRLVAAREYELDNIAQRKEIWREAMKINLNAKTGKQSHTFEVQLPLNRDPSLLEFSAYAFNEDRVKSNTAHWINSSWSTLKPAKVAGPKPKIYLVSVGVNASQNKEWELQYAAKDATEMGRILSEKLNKVGSYEVVNIPLISDTNDSGVLTTNDATKEKIKTVFALLAGQKLDTAQTRLVDELKRSCLSIARIQKVTPDDAVLISFSSHGYADNKGNFYLFPFDIGPSDRKLEIKEMLPHAISSDELSLWLMGIDGGEMAMIIDACHAAASVENREFKPGPMGSRGLGQLAYDKRISILTATQELAFEAGGKLNQGLLSFALLQDGLERSLADFKAKPDGKIYLKEWLEYGETRVPQLYEDLRNNRIKGISRSERLTKILNEQAGYQQRPSLFDFSRRDNSIIISQGIPHK